MSWQTAYSVQAKARAKNLYAQAEAAELAMKYFQLLQMVRDTEHRNRYHTYIQRRNRVSDDEEKQMAAAAVAARTIIDLLKKTNWRGKIEITLYQGGASVNIDRHFRMKFADTGERIS